MERTLEERIEEARTNYPNLWRAACELARCKNPDRVLAALLAVAGDVLEQEEPRP